VDVEREAITWWPEGWRWRPFTICILRSSHPGWHGLRQMLDDGPIYRVIGEWLASAGAAPRVASLEPEAVLLPDGLLHLPAPALIAALRDNGVSGKMVVVGERPHHDPYSAIFGWILGLGFVTRVGSVGYYVLLVWGLASQNWSEVGLVFCAYGACRALPLLAIAISARVRSQYRDRELRRWDGVAVAVLPGEIALLVAISVLSIAGGGI